MDAVRSPNAGGLTALVGVALDASPGRIRQAWSADPELVMAEADRLRLALAPHMPGPAHDALARLQHAMGPRRCTLITRAMDGLLKKAAAADTLELEGSVWRLRCADDPDHPRMGIFGRQDRGRRCGVCGGPLRPDVLLPGDPPPSLDDAKAAVARSRVLLLVEANLQDPWVSELVSVARDHQVRTWEVHPQPSPTVVDKSLTVPAERGLPRLVGRWLREDAA